MSVAEAESAEDEDADGDDDADGESSEEGGDEEGGAEGAEELRQAFRLTGYFLARNVFGPRGIKEPEARHGLLAALAKDGLRPLPNLPAEE